MVHFDVVYTLNVIFEQLLMIGVKLPGTTFILCDEDKDDDEEAPDSCRLRT